MRSLDYCWITGCCILAALLPSASADACTSFLLKHPDGPVMAKNYDWDVAEGLLVVNPRGLAKTALVAEGVKPARWTSRYGSATFNQYGREFPTGGLNEVGLAMEVLWLEATEYPEAAGRPSIGALQWVQYCLDSFRSVSDVVASASEVAIRDTARVHFLACDAAAECAVIEFLDGKLVERSQRTLPLPVLTNDSFADSLEYLNRTLGYGGEPIDPEGDGSLARFARAANGVQRVRRTGETNAVDAAFSILADVAQEKSTQWSIVYELRNGQVHYRSSANPSIRTFDLKKHDLDCTEPVLIADLLAKGEGPVALQPFTPEVNRTTIDAGFGAAALAPPPSAETIDAIAGYPATLLCTFDAASE